MILQKLKQLFKKNIHKYNAKLPADNDLDLLDYSIDSQQQVADITASSVNSKKSLSVLKKLFKQQPELFVANYGRALHSYANYLEEQGNKSEALKYAKELVVIYEDLAKKIANTYDEDYARVLNSYANRLGYTEQALEYVVAALEVRKRLAEQDPAAEERYVVLFAHYITRLEELEKHREAVVACQELLPLYKQLAIQRPDDFEEGYARCLLDYLYFLNEVDTEFVSEVAVLAYRKELIILYEKFYTKNPARYASDYAEALELYALDLACVCERKSVLLYWKMALDIRRTLCEKDDILAPYDYGYSLKQFAEILGYLKNTEEGLIIFAEAVPFFQALYEKRPAEFKSYYAFVLTKYAKYLGEIGSIEKALVYARDGLNIYDQLAVENPSRYQKLYIDLFEQYTLLGRI